MLFLHTYIFQRYKKIDPSTSFTIIFLFKDLQTLIGTYVVPPLIIGSVSIKIFLSFTDTSFELIFNYHLGMGGCANLCQQNCNVSCTQLTTTTFVCWFSPHYNIHKLFNKQRSHQKYNLFLHEHY